MNVEIENDADYLVEGDEFPYTLGWLLRKKRSEKGMSRVKLSKFTGITTNTLARYELAGLEGGKYPSAIKLMIICIHLEIDPREAFEYINRDPKISIFKDETDGLFSFIYHFKSDNEWLDMKMNLKSLEDIQNAFEAVQYENHLLENRLEKMNEKMDRMMQLLTKNDSEK
ncbi:helix-turn-helix domain-containing protein [Terasakiella sp.]|uniref:helix-turn-helix domain-containing protein n=1 Tax=Terasakiella sp. TaxID=2034861 RepID=UPI003AA88B1B